MPRGRYLGAWAPCLRGTPRWSVAGVLERWKDNGSVQRAGQGGVGEGALLTAALRASYGPSTRLIMLQSQIPAYSCPLGSIIIETHRERLPLVSAVAKSPRDAEQYHSSPKSYHSPAEVKLESGRYDAKKTTTGRTCTLFRLVAAAR